MKKLTTLAIILASVVSAPAFANEQSTVITARYENKNICAITDASAGYESDLAFLDRDAESVANVKITSNTGAVTITLTDSNVKGSAEGFGHKWISRGSLDGEMKGHIEYPLNVYNGQASVNLFPQIQATMAQVPAGMTEVTGTFTVACK